MTAIPTDALPDRLRPGVLWWCLTVPSIGVGGYALSLQDARSAQDSVPGMPWLDELHFIAGGLALAVGPFLFRRDILARATDWHHKLGWLYVTCVFASGTAACAMACYSMEGLTTHLGFGALGVLWLITTGLGVRAVKARAFPQHRRWMVLSFALCFAAASLRVQLPLLASGFQSFPIGYRIVSWSCWVPNLLFAWWWLTRTDLSGRRHRPTID